jgi:hypothetical protein
MLSSVALFAYVAVRLYQLLMVPMLLLSLLLVRLLVRLLLQPAPAGIFAWAIQPACPWLTLYLHPWPLPCRP